MNILILVSIADKPFGGHYHTAFSYLNTLKKDYHVDLLVIGNEKPNWLSDYSGIFIYYNGLNLLSALANIKKYVKNYDVLHAFDEFAYFFIRNFGTKSLAYTRCGGPNPVGRYFPCVDKLICLSYENYSYFKTSRKINHTILLPNRVPDFTTSDELIKELKVKYHLCNEAIVLMRICRIDQYYLKSIEQTISLGHQLVSKGIMVEILVVGAVYDYVLLNELRSTHSSVKFVVEDRFTKNAKLVLDCADMVVGTGRSLMEAAIKNKIVFSPVANAELPSLLIADNIVHFFNNNFSERTIVPQNEQLNIDNVVLLLTNNEMRGAYQEFIYTFSVKNFLLDKVPTKLKECYLMPGKDNNFIDYCRQLIRVSSVFFRFSLRKLRENITHHKSLSK